MKNLAFGLMRLPQIDGKVDIERTKTMVDVFIENGFTYFDTAAGYIRGQSEVSFREAVSSRYPRDAYTITDKLSLFMIKSAEEIEPFFEKQLNTLGVDYLDVYLAHALNRDAYQTALKWGAFDFMRKKLAEGKVKHIGFSFHDDAETLDKILTEQPDMEYVQLQINYIDWNDVGVQARKCYEVARKHGKKILVMEPVKGGSLVKVSDNVKAHLNAANPEMSIASWAIRFAASLPGVVMVLSGMSTEEQLLDNISCMKEFKPFDDREMATVMKAADMIKEEIAIPCTACRYCVDYCPQNIVIPDYFTFFNMRTRYGEIPWGERGDLYDLLKENGKPSDCIKCGACEGHCPQNIDIRARLEDCKVLEKR